MNDHVTKLREMCWEEVLNNCKIRGRYSTNDNYIWTKQKKSAVKLCMPRSSGNINGE